MSNIITTTNTSNDMFDVMDKAYKFANIFAKSDIVPAHYRGKPENTFIAVQTAYRMNLDPMLIMQNTYVVKGKLGMNSTFAISLANCSGIFDSGIRYKLEGSGDDLKVTAYAKVKNTGEEISYTIAMREAIAEGWTENKKYKTLPELMLRYRAAIFLIRTHVPEVLNGMHMVEEIEDMCIKTVEEEQPSQHLSKTDMLKSYLETKEEIAEPDYNAADNGIIYDGYPEEEQKKALVNELRTLILSNNIPTETTAKWLDKAHVDNISDLGISELKACIDFVKNKYE